MSIPRIVAGMIVAGALVMAGASEGAVQFCGTLTTTVAGQAPVPHALEVAVGAPVEGAPVLEVIGRVVSNGDVVRGPVVILPGGTSARVGLTMTDVNLERVRFVGLLVDLASASGTGLFVQIDGTTGTAAVQVGPCP